MSGIFFKTNFYTNCDVVLFKESLDSMNHRGPDETILYFNNDFSMGHKNLLSKEYVNGKSIISIYDRHLLFDGEVYNRDELGIKDYKSDLLLVSSLLKENDKKKVLNKINGIFSLVYVNNNNVFIARDKIGIKPLYYAIYNDDIIISSEIKGILKYIGEAVVDKEGLCELLGMLPSHTPGKTIYKGIYELEAGHYLTFNHKEGLKIEKYFDLTPKDFNLSLDDTKSMVKHLLCDAINKQVGNEISLCSFLSGGLDSSVIVGVINEQKKNLNTFSINYEDNDKDYTLNQFETSKDEDYVHLMNTKHTTITIDNSTLIDYLKTAVVLRDSPGMADIDASLYYLCKRVHDKYNTSTSGEISDEIFGGYPWYYKNDKYDIFPWIRNLDYRCDLINKDLDINIKEYVNDKYLKILKETPILPSDSKERVLERQMYYLNYKYFMASLVERHDRMTSGASLNVKVPFSDYRLVEFLYNVPFKYKYYNKTEKALLRDSMKEFIPEDIYLRKKSPYPKTRSKGYSRMIKKLLQQTLKNKSSILYTLFDNDKLIELASTNKELDVPWYGQLMRLDQLRAFLYQIDFWYKEYNIKLDL